MAEDFDVIVIGSGSAATAAAFGCRRAGWRVAVIDSRPFGGTCALRGCDPKKVLVGAAEALDRVRALDGRGLEPDGARIEWGHLMRFKRGFTAPVPQSKEQAFAQAGIAAFHGRARFVGRTSIQVDATMLTGKHVVIAAGARAADLGIPGAEHAITSEQFLELDGLPSRLAFLGGGYISFEFAHVAARAGAHPVILHRGVRPLEHFDPDLVSLLLRRTRELGIDVRLQAEVTAIEKTRDGFVITTTGDPGTVTADLIVHGAGRVPDIDDLGLDAAGVERGRRGVRVNEYLQSVSNPAVYAAGDADGSGPPLTPVAAYEGNTVAANLVEGNKLRPDYTGVPSVVFTIPPLSAVGFKEDDGKKAGQQFRVKYQDTSSWYASRRIGETCSGFKTIVEEATGRIVGAHLLGHNADEMVNLFALAIRRRLTIADIKDVIYAYPTHGSNVAYMF
jgi:glutathione reductase (NADPH)